MINNLEITAEWVNTMTGIRVYEIGHRHYMFTDISGAHKMKFLEGNPVVIGYTHEALKRFFRFEI